MDSSQQQNSILNAKNMGNFTPKHTKPINNGSYLTQKVLTNNNYKLMDSSQQKIISMINSKNTNFKFLPIETKGMKPTDINRLAVQSLETIGKKTKPQQLNNSKIPNINHKYVMKYDLTQKSFTNNNYKLMDSSQQQNSILNAKNMENFKPKPIKNGSNLKMEIINVGKAAAISALSSTNNVLRERGCVENIGRNVAGAFNSDLVLATEAAELAIHAVLKGKSIDENTKEKIKDEVINGIASRSFVYGCVGSAVCGVVGGAIGSMIGNLADFTSEQEQLYLNQLEASIKEMKNNGASMQELKNELRYDTSVFSESVNDL
ncbi:hypothetical protein ABK040_013343 [Willaertia magna]